MGLGPKRARREAEHLSKDRLLANAEEVRAQDNILSERELVNYIADNGYLVHPYKPEERPPEKRGDYLFFKNRLKAETAIKALNRHFPSVETSMVVQTQRTHDQEDIHIVQLTPLVTDVLEKEFHRFRQLERPRYNDKDPTVIVMSLPNARFQRIPPKKVLPASIAQAPAIKPSPVVTAPLAPIAETEMPIAATVTETISPAPPHVEPSVVLAPEPVIEVIAPVSTTEITAPVVTQVELPAPVLSPATEAPASDMPSMENGKALLLYALGKQWSFGQLLEQLYKKSGLSQLAFSTSLGLTRHQYTRLADGSMKDPTANIINNIIQRMGMSQPEDAIEWRKYIQGIPFEINQKWLGECFDMESDHALDTESFGKGRTIALAKFFKTLGECHGIVKRTDLAEAIAKNNAPDAAVTEILRLRITIDNIAGPQENALIDISNQPPEYLESADRRVKRMDTELAQKIAAYAFPDDKNGHDRVMEFLTSEKYLVPAELSSQRRSAAMTEVRATKTDWGKRASNAKPDQNFER